MSNVAKLVLATTNAHKVREVNQILAEVLPIPEGSIISAAAYNLPPLVENGLTFAENALIKARALASASQLPALADDSGLCVSALGGAPGIFSARWAGRHGNDQANLDLLLDQLTDLPDEHRTAWFECAVALVLPDATETVTTGRLVGCLARQPRGEGGFGYDPILVPDGLTQTCAELSASAKHAISHRGQAIRAMAPHLAKLFGLAESLVKVS
ncbi:MAG: RdgB/HAM1 family non-canonical purine NTP pyrophosphatase [Bifidobacteriaceae bacterium]|jgi:XTP/dITP diphosphohydrolase|nr:RdgB/HAM1 family non-canonical purine NTP pyrophosphatase [Bifidobacteriaceae bacterium]